MIHESNFLQIENYILKLNPNLYLQFQNYIIISSNRSLFGCFFLLLPKESKKGWSPPKFFSLVCYIYLLYSLKWLLITCFLCISKHIQINEYSALHMCYNICLKRCGEIFEELSIWWISFMYNLILLYLVDICGGGLGQENLGPCNELRIQRNRHLLNGIFLKNV